MKTIKLTRRGILIAAVTLIMSAGIALAAVCKTCDGAGTGSTKCFFCKGSGSSGAFKCTHCNGKGFSKCSTCQGTGQTKK